MNQSPESSAPESPRLEEASRQGQEVLETISLGLRVWWSEMRWLLREALGALETRQLVKRMAQERARLAGPQAPGLSAADREQAVRQIAFLEEEIRRLDQDRAARREHFVAARIKAWGLDG